MGETVDEIMIEKTIWFIFIIWNSFIDIRKKEISLCSFFIVSVWKFVLAFIGREIDWMDLFISCTPGICFLALSLVSKNAVGAGDGLVLLVTGWYLGVFATIEILFWGLLSSAIFSICLLLFRKIHRKTEIPFVPFLFLGYVIFAARMPGHF